MPAENRYYAGVEKSLSVVRLRHLGVLAELHVRLSQEQYGHGHRVE